MHQWLRGMDFPECRLLPTTSLYSQMAGLTGGSDGTDYLEPNVCSGREIKPILRV